MSDLYLIAHKVRGEPAFDVAINIGDETSGDLWIIPTSGHRAYPFHYYKISDLADVSDYPHKYPQVFLDDVNPLFLEAIQDHYAVNNRPASSSVAKITDLDDLLSDL